jgi:hypothetical protein
MLTIVLGAPGSGTSTIAPILRTLLTRHVVIDWDDLMPAAAALSGRDVRASPDLWAPYRSLVQSIVRTVLPSTDVVVLGVSTRDELIDWPPASWVLVDCNDHERRRRLADRPRSEVDDAIADAAKYRHLGFPVVDSSGRAVEEVAAKLMAIVARR